MAMDKLDGVLIDTDVLVVGAGAGGLMAALSAKRNGPAGTRVTLVDSWLIGRTGHTAFSNAWTIVVLPGDDLDGILHEIVAGNDGIADQVLVRQSLVDSAARLADFEFAGQFLDGECEAAFRVRARRRRGLALVRAHGDGEPGERPALEIHDPPAGLQALGLQWLRVRLAGEHVRARAWRRIRHGLCLRRRLRHDGRGRVLRLAALREQPRQSSNREKSQQQQREEGCLHGPGGKRSRGGPAGPPRS